MVKIIFFDIDGTLIDIDADDMSDKTKYALQKLKENKILIRVVSPKILNKSANVNSVSSFGNRRFAESNAFEWLCSDFIYVPPFI